MNSIRASIRRRGWREAGTFSTTAIAVLLLGAACGGSQTSTAPSSSAAPSTSAAPTKSAGAAAPAGFAADLTFSGAINGHVTEARAASDKIFVGPCTPGSVRVGVTVAGHGYTVSAASFGDQARPEEVYINGEDVQAGYQGDAGKVTFKAPRSVVLDVDLVGRGNTEGNVHLSGTASC